MSAGKKMTKATKVALVQALIDRNEYGVPFPDDDVVRLNELLGSDFKEVRREHNAHYPANKRHLSCDGRATSWRAYIYPQNERQWLHKAFRYAIWEETDHWLAEQEHKWCAECFSTDDLTTDHIDPPFSVIADRFIAMTGVIPLEKSIYGGWEFADEKQRAAWLAYHNAEANYQVLCRSCNSRKGARIAE